METVRINNTPRFFTSSPTGTSFRMTEALLQDNGVRKLLDVISSIIADEYIEIAKENRESFIEIASALPRNDDGKGFKPYYVAHMKAQTLVLLDKSDKGANWERWWAR